VPQVVPQISRYEELMSVSDIFRAKEKLVDLTGFSVQYLVALPGIEPGF
jgi:hypothetical protein